MTKQANEIKQMPTDTKPSHLKLVYANTANRVRMFCMAKNLLSDGKHNKANPDFDNEKNYFQIRIKLEDPAYINGAVYRLATIITNKILNLRGEL